MQAQANFVRVRIDRLDGDSSTPPPQPQLLCVVRTLLKKIKQTVLVGDEVEVTGIDWTDGRGLCLEVESAAGICSGNSQMSFAASKWMMMQHSMDTSMHGHKSCMCESAGMVQEVLHRRNAMTDPAIANIDQALMVFSLAQVPA